MFYDRLLKLITYTSATTTKIQNNLVCTGLVFKLSTVHRQKFLPGTLKQTLLKKIVPNRIYFKIK